MKVKILNEGIEFPEGYEYLEDSDNLTLAIPRWFIEKNLDSDDEMVFYYYSYNEIIKETAKAYLIKCNVDSKMGGGTFKFWCPKSIIPSEKKLKELEKEEERMEKIRDAYYHYLRDTAKENGVRLGSIQKWKKITALLEKNGVKVKPFKQFMEEYK